MELICTVSKETVNLDEVAVDSQFKQKVDKNAYHGRLQNRGGGGVKIKVVKINHLEISHVIKENKQIAQ